MEKMIFGLVGRNISYSFSKNYFNNKFKELKNNNYTYLNFDISSISEIHKIINDNNIRGLNITIPYKEEVLKLLDKTNKKAKKIGAVNTIRITKKGKLKGYNTDEYGFRKSLIPLLKNHHQKALILGTGGASKAVAYSLSKLNIKYQFVSRTKTKNGLLYSEIDTEMMSEHHLIINCTPLGTSPNISICPDIPYTKLTKKHILYDLVYNPEISLFLQKGKEKGTTIKNGYEMLVLQAEKAWDIWTKD